MTLSDIAIRRPVFTTMMSVAIMVLGAFSFSRIPVDLYPDVEFPVVSVVTAYPGASPREIETQVTEKIEDAIVSVSGIDQIVSYSRDSVSQVIIIFDLDVDIDNVANQVREQVGSIRHDLPRSIEEPSITRMNLQASPVQSYTLSGSMEPRELRYYAEDVIAPMIEQVRGVASVRVRGGAERQINVLIDLKEMQAKNLTPNQIVEKLQLENLNVPGGDYNEGERRINVRTVGEFRSLDDIRNLAIGATPGGTVIRLGEIAEIEDGVKDPDSVVRTNGDPAVVLDVLKASGENTVRIAQEVSERIANYQFEGDVSMQIMFDASEFILENAAEVETALLFGGGMAILVILLFMLDVRSTIISGLALPTSVIGTFFLMYLLDYSLNMMTLLGLALAIGILIDDSIVVRENIVKHLERGEDPYTAASKGTREIMLAVLATTATLCAVFVPVAFTSGIVGQFFRQFGITIAASVCLSAFVAFTLDPMLSARFAKQRKPGERDPWEWLKRPFLNFYRQLDALYLASLKWVVASRKHMAIVLIASFAMLFGSFALAGIMGNEFMAAEDRGQFNVVIEVPAGTSLEETAAMLLPAEEELANDPRFITVYSNVGDQGDAHVTAWRIRMVPKWERKENLAEMQDHVRSVILKHVPEAKLSIMLPSIDDGGRNYPMILYLKGPDFETLESVAYDVRDRLMLIAGMHDIHLDYQPGKPELQFEVNRDRAAALGVSTAMIASTLRTALEGEVAGVFRDGDDEYDIRVRLREEDRDAARDLELLTVPIFSAGQPVGFMPIREVTTQVRGLGPAVIERLDRSRTIKITAAAKGRALSEVVDEMMETVASMDLPETVTYELGGDAKFMNESNENMALALLLGILFIYIVLASQFESFLQPITIMMALPLAMIGAFVAVFATGWTMSMGIMIGLILLMGLVTKNGILLVDHALVAVREGKTPVEAILEAGPARLRPILMTSAAMILGMLPSATSQGSGSEFRGPMAVGIIGGVISSTFLTLLVTPVFFLIMEWVTRVFVRKKKTRSPEEIEEALARARGAEPQAAE